MSLTKDMTIRVSWREPRNGSGRRKIREIDAKVFDEASALALIDELAKDTEIKLLKSDLTEHQYHVGAESYTLMLPTYCGREPVTLTADSIQPIFIFAKALRCLKSF